MIPGWLKSFVAWLVGLFVHEAVEQVKEEVEKPSTIQDANTPKKALDDWNNWVANRLREPSDRDKQ